MPGVSTGPAPLLSNLPFERERLDTLIGGGVADFTNSISTSFDLDGYSLAIGPTMSGRIARKWSWQGSAGFTLNFYRWRARETESLDLSLNGAAPIVFQEWSEDQSGTDFRLGLYFKGDLVRELSRDWLLSKPRSLRRAHGATAP